MWTPLSSFIQTSDYLIVEQNIHDFPYYRQSNKGQSLRSIYLKYEKWKHSVAFMLRMQDFLPELQSVLGYDSNCQSKSHMGPDPWVSTIQCQKNQTTEFSGIIHDSPTILIPPLLDEWMPKTTNKLRGAESFLTDYHITS